MPTFYLNDGPETVWLNYMKRGSVGPASSRAAEGPERTPHELAMYEKQRAYDKWLSFTRRRLREASESPDVILRFCPQGTTLTHLDAIWAGMSQANPRTREMIDCAIDTFIFVSLGLPKALISQFVRLLQQPEFGPHPTVSTGLECAAKLLKATQKQGAPPAALPQKARKPKRPARPIVSDKQLRLAKPWLRELQEAMRDQNLHQATVVRHVLAATDYAGEATQVRKILSGSADPEPGDIERLQLALRAARAWAGYLAHQERARAERAKVPYATLVAPETSNRYGAFRTRREAYAPIREFIAGRTPPPPYDEFFRVEVVRVSSKRVQGIKRLYYQDTEIAEIRLKYINGAWWVVVRIKEH